MRYDFMILDVFTAKPFGGNQLAVLTDARGLTSEAMQTIAREFNFPESTFVLPADDPAHACRVRIFTPAVELPFAGHPTVGTACALAMLEQVPIGDIVLEEGVGPVPVSTARDGDAYSARFRLDRAPQMFDAPSAGDMAAILSLEADEIVDVFSASVGVNFTYVQLRSREAVDQCQLDLDAWRRLLSSHPASQVYMFAGDLKDRGEIYSRMFGPGFGIAEDPATGAAAAAIVGVAASRSGSLNLRITQGVRMGRPSSIDASAAAENGEVRAIEVGGSCALIAEGSIEVPDDYLER
ncbi:PhzF family phenazine biosynthesis protein [Sphingomonas sp. URHD0057]|uniref:PhzF family phenazine biosynthesis protein n=1 Tax=Sphingomonas sp. URHD0057 TaxID=1380389 RepID=UPI00048D1598|nr:PhzF family phenazine biosynthesis protein [Sphingomonas sp. URHD0057]